MSWESSSAKPQGIFRSWWIEFFGPVLILLLLFLNPWAWLGGSAAPLVLIGCLALIAYALGWRAGLISGLLITAGQWHVDVLSAGSNNLTAERWSDLTALLICSLLVGIVSGWRRPYTAPAQELDEAHLSDGGPETVSRVDVVTGLPNRRICLQLGEAEWSRWRRFASPFSLLLFEIDGLQEWRRRDIAVADSILRATANVLTSSIRSLDMAGRFDQNQILLILPQTNLAGALVVGNKLLQRVRETVIQKEDESTISVSCSVGATGVQRQDARFPELLARAASALQQARADGGDRINGSDSVPSLEAQR